MKKTRQIHRWRKLLAIALSVVLAINAVELLSLAADPSDAPTMAVGDGTATDGSDEWVLEYAGKDVTASGSIIGRQYFIRIRQPVLI